jgi:imidazolonepropionase-like amidohydrolase
MLGTALPAAQADTTVLTFARLWDGAQMISPATVVVRGDRIVGVTNGPASGVPVDASRIDLSSYTAIPGLIDLHTHMTYYWDGTPGTRPLGQRRNPAVTVFLAQENALRTLETGVTTVRDLGASNDTDGPGYLGPARPGRRSQCDARDDGRTAREAG